MINIFPYEATGQSSYEIYAAVIPSHEQFDIVVNYQVIESEQKPSHRRIKSWRMIISPPFILPLIIGLRCGFELLCSM